MKFTDHLSEEQKQKLLRLSKPTKKYKNNKKAEKKMSRRDWEELMGTNRDTYKRVRGAIRRK